MKAEFFFDTACPWCYLGKTRLVRALRQHPDVTINLRWSSFLLNPDMPLEGAERTAYLIRKLGGAARVQRQTNAVASACMAEGVGINFDRITRIPNTVHSHRLIKFAALRGLAIPALDTVFAAYFKHGVDIGAIDELIELGTELGLDELELAHYLFSDADIAEILGDTSRAHRLGVSGVPCVIINDRFAITGAQETHVLSRLLDLAAVNDPEPVSAGAITG